jgi:hypothetical protein
MHWDSEILYNVQPSFSRPTGIALEQLPLKLGSIDVIMELVVPPRRFVL